MVKDEVKELIQPFILSEEQLREVYRLINDHLHRGLKKATNASSDIKCYVSYVHDLPTGREKGPFLALDLGGTNFRVLLVTLKGENGDAEFTSQVYALPKEVITGPGEKLFDHIAECLGSFVKERNLSSTNLPLGFTFSFPCVQIGLDKAKLVRWTKGFSSPGVVGQDVGRLLREAIQRHGDMSIEVLAILNDTVGTLMSCAHRNPDCKIGLIVGTGTNACYVERTECTEMLEPELQKIHKHVIINCESGAFGDSGCLEFIQTDQDKQVDKSSINATKQMYEKLASGMYLGELLRLSLIKGIQENRVFPTMPNKGETVNLLKTRPDCIKGRFMSEMGADSAPNFQHTRTILKDLFGMATPSDEDCETLHYMSEVIMKRSAYLCGLLLSVLINKMGYTKVVVGVDGSVYRYHPKFDSYMREIMNRFVDSKTTYDIQLSEDGSGRGAALIAAVAASHAK